MDQQRCAALIRVASGNFRDSEQNFVYFTEEFVVFWGGEKAESALTHDKHVAEKEKEELYKALCTWKFISTKIIYEKFGQFPSSREVAKSV